MCNVDFFLVFPSCDCRLKATWPRHEHFVNLVLVACGTGKCIFEAQECGLSLIEW